MNKRVRRIIMAINGLLGCVLAGLLAVLVISWLNAGARVLKPYTVSFGDDIAIRCLYDGSIEATVAAFEEADWQDFQENGYMWGTQYTEEEYRAVLADFDSERSFAQMQASADYVDVSAGIYGTLAAVHADGSVSFNERAIRRYKVSAQDPEWKNVKELELGAYSVLALKNDGAVSAAPWNPAYVLTEGTSPETWTNVKTISNDIIGVGLKTDGTVCWTTFPFEPWDPDHFIPLDEMDTWKDIVQVEAGWETVAGLRADGTVVLAGDTCGGQEAALSWTNIQKIAVGMEFIVGLKQDGTLVSTAPWPLVGGEKLKNVVDVYANRHYVLAILSSGKARLLGAPEEKIQDGAWPAGKWVFPGE